MHFKYNFTFVKQNKNSKTESKREIFETILGKSLAQVLFNTSRLLLTQLDYYYQKVNE